LQLKQAKLKEREEWAKNAKLEFYDEEVGAGSKANGLLLALASKRLQGKIYHTPREGSWWSENPDVAAPRPPGIRPNSAVFRWEKKFVHEDEPNVVLDRRTADLMADVDEVRERSIKGIKKAKIQIQEAKSVVADMDKRTVPGGWNPHIIPHPIKRRIIRYKMRFKKSKVGQRYKMGRELVKNKLPPMLSPSKRKEIAIPQATATPDNTTDEEEDEAATSESLKWDLRETPVSKALGRGRKRPTSANKHVRLPRPKSASAGTRPRSTSGAGFNMRRSSSPRRSARPKSAGPVSGRRRINFDHCQ